MAIEIQEITHESQIGLTKKRSSQTHNDMYFIVFPTIKSMGSLCSSTDAIIIDDDDEEEITLEPKKKKQRLGSWWNYDDAVNELSCVVKGSSKAKDNNDVVSSVDSCFISTDHIHEKKKDDTNSSLSSIRHDNFIDLSEDDIVGESTCSSNKGNGHVTLEELGVTVEDLKSMPWELFEPISRVDSCFSSTDLHETETTKKKDDTNSSLSSIHHDNFIDLSEDEIVCETTISSSNKGNGHVTLEELGVTVEDLKSMPWELFDPTWEIRSETMDPWLGGYVKDIISPCL
ncbi:hypothetical protein AALP_AA2G172200 [Arabis alpina]|uniref:Uncharacterized protein n=1 Tax=Arabis alpina TaxID=50452 RepID=A0A087HI36_ARAAL|nr:hypothetical protein AALP_AA2G172200 [Arabis alpina]